MPAIPIGLVTWSSSASTKPRSATGAGTWPTWSCCRSARHRAKVPIGRARGAGSRHHLQVFGVAEAHDQYQRCRVPDRAQRPAPDRRTRTPRWSAAGPGKSRRGCRSMSRRMAADPARRSSAWPTWPPPNRATGDNTRARRWRSIGSAAPLPARTRRCMTPPQHWPRLGSQRKATLALARGAGCSISRADAIACNSTCPPPMVPTTASANTAIQVAASRGTEPWVRTTVTQTAASRARRSKASSACFTTCSQIKNGPSDLARTCSHSMPAPTIGSCVTGWSVLARPPPNPTSRIAAPVNPDPAFAPDARGPVRGHRPAGRLRVPYRTPPEPTRPQPQAPPEPAAPAAVLPAPAAVPPVVVIAPVAVVPSVSGAATALAYRRDAATHLYAHNAAAYLQGHAASRTCTRSACSMSTSTAGPGHRVSWRRAPKHAPEVMEEIIRTVRRPRPTRCRRAWAVTYSDVWLWDKSGQVPARHADRRPAVAWRHGPFRSRGRSNNSRG
jgi:protein TonB